MVPILDAATLFHDSRASDRFQSIVARYRSLSSFQTGFTVKVSTSGADGANSSTREFLFRSNKDTYSIQQLEPSTRRFDGTKSTTFADPFQVFDSSLLSFLGFRTKPVAALIGNHRHYRPVYLLGLANDSMWTIVAQYGSIQSDSLTVIYAMDSFQNRITSISTILRMPDPAQTLYTSEVTFLSQKSVP